MDSRAEGQTWLKWESSAGRVDECEWNDLGLLPERVEYPPVVPDPEHAVGRGDPVGVGLLGIAKERVWDPDLPDHVAVEAQDLHGAVELQAPVVPGLSEEDVDGVFLSAGRNQEMFRLCLC